MNWRVLGIWCLTMFGSMMLLPTFATVEQPTWEGFGSVKVITDDEWIKLAGTEKDQDSNLIDVVKGFVNWTLGILWLIALVVLLRGGFQILIAAGDSDKVSNGWKIVKNALIGLAIIWVAWFIVSIIFFVINLLTVESVGTDAGTTS